MVQPQRYGSIREFLDNLPRQPCIWQPENQNICVTCLRINEPVARVCSVWSQALDDAPLEELDFEEEMRSLPAVEKVAESPATPGLVEIDVVSDWNMEPATAAPVAAEPVVAEPAAEPSIAVVDIDMVPPTEPAVAEEPAAEEAEPAEIGDAEEDEVASGGGGDEYFVFPDGRGGAGGSREVDFPGDVFSRTPSGWEVLFGAYSVAAGAAPRGPVRGCCVGRDQQCGQ